MTACKFCYPVKILENDRVKLVPFDPDLHLPALLTTVKPDQHVVAKYCPIGPFEEAEEALQCYKDIFESSSTGFLYAVMVRIGQYDTVELGGAIGLVESDPTHQITEIGGVLTIPKFQGTSVTKNAVGLLLQYTLDPPPEALGLRRVQWQTHAANAASIGIAKRMGLTLEAVLRWERQLPSGKFGLDAIREGQKPGRHSAMLAICWDDWIEKRQEIVGSMEN